MQGRALARAHVVLERAARSELAAKRVGADAAMQDLCAKEQIHNTRMDKDAPRSVLDQASGDGSIIVVSTSERWDLHSDADKTDWQGQSVPNSSIGGSELGAPSSSTGPQRTSTTKGGAVHMLLLFCACDDDDATGPVEAGPVEIVDEEGNDDDDEFPTDAQLVLTLRAVYARHRHDLSLTRRTLTKKTETELGGADLSRRKHVINTTVALIKKEEAEVKAGARAGSVIVETSVIVDGGAEAAATFASSLTDPAKPLVEEFRGPCAVSGVRVEESAAAAAPAAAASAEAPAEPAPPPPPATDKSPLRAINVVFHDDDDKRHPKEETEGYDGGLWDFSVADNENELDGEEEEAARQDSYVAPWDSGRASAAAAAADVGLQLRRMIGDGFTPNRQTSVKIDVYLEEHTREESPSTTAPDDASSTGHSYNDIIKSPPSHLRCVVSPFSSLPPVLRCTAASPPCFLSPTSRG